MKLKLSFLVLLLVTISFLTADYYDISYYLPNYVPINQNNPSVYKTQKGLSVSQMDKYNLGAYNQDIEYKIDHINQLVEIVVKSGQIILAGPFYISWDDYHLSFRTRSCDPSKIFNGIFCSIIKCLPDLVL